MIGIGMPLLVHNKTAGFTLMELLVAMAISLVVLAGVAGTFTAQTRQNNAEEQIAQMQQNARGALDLMVREIQMAGYKPNGGTVTGVTYSASQLEIQADMDGNGSINTASGSDEDIVYAYDSVTLQITRKLGSSGTAQLLADNVTEFTFSYLDANGSATTTSSSVRKVSISITARTAKPDPSFPNNGGYRTYQLSADITPPNLAL
jgi:type IV pilus assembly protein PilW